MAILDWVLEASRSQRLAAQRERKCSHRSNNTSQEKTIAEVDKSVTTDINID